MYFGSRSSTANAVGANAIRSKRQKSFERLMSAPRSFHDFKLYGYRDAQRDVVVGVGDQLVRSRVWRLGVVDVLIRIGYEVCSPAVSDRQNFSKLYARQLSQFLGARSGIVHRQL